MKINDSLGTNPIGKFFRHHHDAYDERMNERAKKIKGKS
jgi:hypothetical protein